MSPADPTPSTHIWPSTHAAFPEGIQNLWGIFRNHPAGLRENCQWGYSGAGFCMSEVSFCFHVLPSFSALPMCTHMETYTHTNTNRTWCKDEMRHVPSLPVLVVRAVRWGVEYMLYLGTDGSCHRWCL